MNNERLIILMRVIGFAALIGAIPCGIFIRGPWAGVLVFVAWALLDSAMHAQKKLGKEIISWNSNGDNPRAD